MTLFDYDADLALAYLIKLTVAFVLALPVAWDRERNTRIMGLRTYPLIAMATCAFLLVAQDFIGDGPPDAHARVLQGLMGGIGFIGAGAILKDGNRVLGTATAASIWTMGALGAAVAYGNLEIAILLLIANMVVLRALGQLKEVVDGKNNHQHDSQDTGGDGT